MPTRIFRQTRRPQVSLIPFGPFRQGVNEKSEPHLLEFSELSGGGNVVLDEIPGRALKRPGTLFRKTLPFLTDPPKKAYNFVKRDGTSILVVTDHKKLIASQDLDSWDDITPTAFLSGGSFAAGSFELDFETAEDRLWITNGADDVFSWDGIVASPSTDSLVAYDKATAEITHNVGDTGTSIIDALLDRAGDGTTWVGQIIVCTESVNTENIGITRRVKTFTDGTDTITFDAFPTALTNGDKFLVGVVIPKGRYPRHHHNTMFMGSTPENAEEVRFHEDVDPNEPTIRMEIDNPNAWPALNQIEVGSTQGDRIYGFTRPVYRNRIGVFKSGGIYRIEPDPTFKFVPVTITEQYGSRFPGSWQQHDEVLIFMGQDKDGLPDVYMTDFVTVKHFNRKHSTTLDDLQQPNAVLRSKSISLTSEFDSGIKSTFVDTAGGQLRIDKLNTKSEYIANLISGSNVDIETVDGVVSILGLPKWDNKYEADDLPGDATPAWTVSGSGFSQVIDTSILKCTVTQPIFPGEGSANYRKENILSSTQDAYMVIRAKSPLGGSLYFGLGNGSKAVSVDMKSFPGNSFNVFGATTKDLAATFNHSQVFNIYHLLLKSDGTYKLWANGTQIDSGTAADNTTENSIHFGLGELIRAGHGGVQGVPFGTKAEFDYVREVVNFKGDSLSSQGGKISPTSLPATLPTAGDITFLSDYKKDIQDNPSLHRFGKYHFDVTLNGGTNTLQSQSSIDEVVYSSLETFTDGQEPGVDNSTPIRRFIRLKASFTAADISESPELNQFVGGILYLTDQVRIGNNIRAWDIFQVDDSNFPPTKTIKIRIATAASLGVLTEPDSTSETGWDTGLAGSDAEGFVVIANADNIGTILGGDEGTPNPPFPNALFAQIKYEAHLDSISEANSVEHIVLNWLEGAAEFLPSTSVMFKKKWLFPAATSTSTVNDIVVTVDRNRAFSNWTGFNPNFFVWFRGKIYYGDANGKELLELLDTICQDDDGADVSGRKIKAIDSFIDTKQEIVGAIHQRKKARYLEVAGNVEQSDVTLSYRRDVESTFTTLGSASFSTSVNHKRLHFPIGVQFKRIILRARNNSLNQNFGLEGLIMQAESVPSRSGL